MMKLWIIALLSIVVGTAAGFGLTAWELLRAGDDFGARTTGGVEAITVKTVPRVVVEGGEEFNFGKMERGTIDKRAFVFKNLGAAPLDEHIGQRGVPRGIPHLGHAERRAGVEHDQGAGGVGPGGDEQFLGLPGIVGGDHQVHLPTVRRRAQ